MAGQGSSDWRRGGWWRSSGGWWRESGSWGDSAWWDDCRDGTAEPRAGSAHPTHRRGDARGGDAKPGTGGDRPTQHRRRNRGAKAEGRSARGTAEGWLLDVSGGPWTSRLPEDAPPDDPAHPPYRVWVHAGCSAVGSYAWEWMRQAVWQLDCKISTRKARSWTRPPIPWVIAVRGRSAAMALEAALDVLVCEYPDYVSPEDVQPDPLTQALLAEWQATRTARGEQTAAPQAQTAKLESEAASVSGSPPPHCRRRWDELSDSSSGSPPPRCRRRRGELSDSSSEDSGPSAPPGDFDLGPGRDAGAEGRPCGTPRPAAVAVAADAAPRR